MSLFPKPIPLIDIDDFKLSLSMMWIRDDTPFLGRVAKGVVLLVPVYETSKRCWKVFERALYRLDPLPEKVIFCENNSNDNTLELISNFKLPHEVIRVWFRKDAGKTKSQNFEPIANVRQLLLTRARTYGAKMAIFLDDDCIPQDRDFIEAFTNNNLDICGGEYLRDFPEGTFVASGWEVDSPIEDMPNGDNLLAVKNLRETIKRAKMHNCPMLIFYYENFSKEAIYKPTVTSAGAMALSEKILQDRRLNFVPLRHDLVKHPEGVSEDFGFCLLARSFGYEIFLDFRIKFAHLGGVSNTAVKHRPWAVDEANDFEF
jgi:hypothetical protein